MEPLIYYESKIYGYILAFVIFLITLIMFFILVGSSGLKAFACFIPPLLIFSFFYFVPSVKIILYDDRFYFERGKKIISAKWNEVVGIHQEPVFTLNLVGYWISKKAMLSGFFVETTKGFTTYIGEVSKDRLGFKPIPPQELIKEIEDRAQIKLDTGSVSVFKQPQRLFNVFWLVAVIFLIPIVIILFYGLYIFIFGSQLDKEMIWSIFFPKFPK